AQLLAHGRPVARVEDQVDDFQDGGEPLRQQVVGRDAERDPGVLDLALRADEPLRHRRLRDDERLRDLLRLEPAQRPERQRQPGLDRERGVAAGEDQAQPLVGDRARLVHLLLRVRLFAVDAFEAAQELRLALEVAVAPDAVDGAVAGHSDQPGSWIRGSPSVWPPLERFSHRVLESVLSKVEVAEDADQDREDTPVLLAEEPLELRRRADQAGTSEPKGQIGRTSTEPYRAVGTFAAHSHAFSNEGASMRKKPPSCSFVSANGPSVTISSPSRTRTVVAVDVGFSGAPVR